MRIGERLKEEREKQGLSQKEVADRLHIARQAVSRWETDQSYPDLENLMALRRLYHVSIDELLGMEKEEISESVEEETVEEEKSVKRTELDRKEQGMVFAFALASCLFPLLGVFVPGVLLWKYRKRKVGVLLKILLVMCILLSVYNCFITLNSWCDFFVETNVTVID